MSPGEMLKDFIVSYIEQNNLEESLEKEVPKKWEKYGDFVLFDERSFGCEFFRSREKWFWLKVAEILKCKRIGIKNKIKNDDYRTPNVTILLGEDPWILHKDNSIIYTWNVEKSMFSAGNYSERLRISKSDCSDEIVVDLFAGIGYFTLPFLIHAKASFVHACEWNPYALEALRRNLILNKVENKCRIYEGDNRLVCPKRIGHRVNLGLIPSSESYWQTACEALVENGGMLHIHENVETKKSDTTCNDCISLISQMGLGNYSKSILMNCKERIVKQGSVNVIWKHYQWLLKGVHMLHSLISIQSNLEATKVWCCSIEKVNFVKSYAPHVDHLVYDIKVEKEN